MCVIVSNDELVLVFFSKRNQVVYYDSSAMGCTPAGSPSLKTNSLLSSSFLHTPGVRVMLDLLLALRPLEADNLEAECMDSASDAIILPVLMVRRLPPPTAMALFMTVGSGVGRALREGALARGVAATCGEQGGEGGRAGMEWRGGEARLGAATVSISSGFTTLKALVFQESFTYSTSFWSPSGNRASGEMYFTFGGEGRGKHTFARNSICSYHCLIT